MVITDLMPVLAMCLSSPIIIFLLCMFVCRVDQPAGVGFSYNLASEGASSTQPSPQDLNGPAFIPTPCPTPKPQDERSVGHDMFVFVRQWFQQHPEMRSLDFYIMGVSESAASI